jgi:hypothetical protein
MIGAARIALRPIRSYKAPFSYMGILPELPHRIAIESESNFENATRDDVIY